MYKLEMKMYLKYVFLINNKFMEDIMKKKIFLLIAVIILITGCTQKTGKIESGSRKVVDMAGREVEIPENIDKIYATGSIGSILLHTLAPEKICGWNNNITENELKYLGDSYKEMPVLGTWKGPKLNGNIEEFLMVKPDLIINIGDVSEAYISDSEEIENKTGIPVLMVDGSIKKTAEAYSFLGEVLKKEERAEKLSEYFKNTLNDVMEVVEDLPEEEKIRVYYAEGSKGLETELQGSINSELLDIAGAVNIAKNTGKTSSQRIQVSLEQIILENPDVIIISTDGDKNHQVYNEITSGGSWSDIKAVQEGKVYEIPCIPYDWINRPPSVNRIIGVKWLVNLLYPEKYEINIMQEVKDFFELYYSYDITDQEIEEILINSKVE